MKNKYEQTNSKTKIEWNELLHHNETKWMNTIKMLWNAWKALKQRYVVEIDWNWYWKYTTTIHTNE